MSKNPYPEASLAKKELREVSMGKDETVTEYVFKLWQRARTPPEDRVETIKNTLKPSIAVPLLGKDFDNLETLLHQARKIEQGRKIYNHQRPVGYNYWISLSVSTHQ